MTAETATPIRRLDTLSLRFVPRPWAFADERRGEIDRHFAAEQVKRPALWNGPVLLLHEFAFAGTTLEGAYLETDFASFLAWRDWNCPDSTMRNCFAMAALQGSDGAFLLGVMGAHTANDGKAYFPAGTPDPHDIFGGMVDLEASVRRELEEETGLSPGDVGIEDGWTAVVEPRRLALMKRVTLAVPAAVGRDRILAHIASETEPELADVRIVRSPADIDGRVPSHVATFLNHVLR